MEQLINYHKLLASIAANRERGVSASPKVFNQDTFERLLPGQFELDAADAAFVSRLLTQAALSGWFPPGELELTAAQGAQRLQVLQQLFNYCISNNEQPQKWWLEKTMRAAVINALISDAQLDAALSGTLPPADEAGQCIREILQYREQTDLSGKGYDDLLHYSLALEALEGVELPKPDLAALRWRIEKDNFLLQQGILDLELFIGRNAEVSELETFANYPAGGDRSEWIGLALAGVGGSGKSALLNKFHRTLFESSNVGMVLIDFDRPGMDPKDTLWLETEIVKQIRLQFGLPDQLANELQTLWTEKLRQGFYYEDLSEKRVFRQFLYNFKEEYLQDGNHRANIWLLILDTYEEVVQRNLTDAIAGWLDELQSTLEPIQLKAVFSGRLVDEYGDIYPIRNVFNVIQIDQFDRPTSEMFLERLGVSELIVRRLLRNKSIPKRPLELKLLAQLYQQEGEDGITQLEKDLAIGGKNTKLYAGIIYRRVLLRLERDELRLMAYPGLILRYLTADLIRNVLAPVLGLGEISAARAGELLQELARYGWLAYLQGDRLWHRKDLRRAILQIMIANDPEKAQKLHLAAIAYFRQDRTEESDIEVFYHQLMLGDFEDVPGANKYWTLLQIEKNLQGDLLDLPLQSRIVFDLFWRQRLTRAQLDSLPEPFIAQGIEVLGKNYIQNGQYLSAFNLITLKERRFLSYLYPSTQTEWQSEASFQTLNWDPIVLDFKSDGNRDLADELTIYLVAMLKYGPGNPEVSRAFSAYLNSGNIFHQFDHRNMRIDGVIGRLAICSLFYKAAGNDMEAIAAPLQNVVGALRNQMAETRSETLSRVVVLLDLCQGHRLFPNYLMRPEFARLDHSWLRDRLSATSSLLVHDDLGRIEKVLQEFDGNEEGWKGKRTPRTLLAAVDRTGKFSKMLEPKHPVIDTPLFFEQIKGPLPEIRNLVKYALIDEFRGSVSEMHELLLEQIPFQLDRQTGAAFYENFRRKPERELEVYIELIDRRWQLDELLYEAHRLRPHSQKLRWVTDLCLLWYRSFQSVWEKT